MTKTFKLCMIFLISEVWLVLMRILFGYLPLSDNASNWLFSGLVQIVGMGVIPFLLYKQWVKGGKITDGFYIKPKSKPLNYLIAIVVGFLLYYVTIGISLIYQNVLIFIGFQHVITGVGTIYSSPWVLVMELITTAMLPAIFEEITNRGLLMSAFEGQKNEKFVLIMMALLFAFGHQNVQQTFYTFFGGLVIAFFALKTRSIIPCMIIHFINNGLSVVLDYSSQKQNALGRYYDAFYDFLNEHFIVIIASWVLVGAIIVLILRFVWKYNKKDEPRVEENLPQRGNNESIYSIFGIGKEEVYGAYGIGRYDAPKSVYVPDAKPKWWEYGMLIAAATLTIAVTVMTFIWGMWR